MVLHIAQGFRFRIADVSTAARARRPTEVQGRVGLWNGLRPYNLHCQQTTHHSSGLSNIFCLPTRHHPHTVCIKIVTRFSS